jgi:hypothetical protein
MTKTVEKPGKSLIYFQLRGLGDKVLALPGIENLSATLGL